MRWVTRFLSHCVAESTGHLSYVTSGNRHTLSFLIGKAHLQSDIRANDRTCEVHGRREIANSAQKDSALLAQERTRRTLRHEDAARYESPHRILPARLRFGQTLATMFINRHEPSLLCISWTEQPDYWPAVRATSNGLVEVDAQDRNGYTVSFSGATARDRWIRSRLSPELRQRENRPILLNSPKLTNTVRKLGYLSGCIFPLPILVL